MAFRTSFIKLPYFSELFIHLIKYIFARTYVADAE